MLIGQMLTKAGLKFISAKGRHTRGGVHIDEIVCETAGEAMLVDEWSNREGYPVKARVGTEEEIADWKRWQE